MPSNELPEPTDGDTLGLTFEPTDRISADELGILLLDLSQAFRILSRARQAPEHSDPEIRDVGDPGLWSRNAFAEGASLHVAMYPALLLFARSAFSALTPLGPRDPRLEIVRISLSSPLRILTWLANADQNVRNAFVQFCKGLMFHDSVRDKLDADAAHRWEEVRQARLRNIEQAIRIAADLSPGTRADPEQVKALLAFTESLDRRPVKLTEINPGEPPPPTFP
jgi:hypothetical protein